MTAGTKLLYPVENQFWGGRIGWVIDPAGHVWTIATGIEETTETQAKQRWERIRKGKALGADAKPSKATQRKRSGKRKAG
jgi:PhnB protein